MALPYRNFMRQVEAATPGQMVPSRADQVANRAGGFVWEADIWQQLRRFLILGSEGGTYYIDAPALTKEVAVPALRACLSADSARAIEEIVNVSRSGRAPKNEAALFALAVAASHEAETVRELALAALPEVARTGTHLLHFAAYVRLFRGWGRGLRKAVANWYRQMPADKLAYQLIKYQQRDGWAHRDLMRLSHPTAPTPTHNDLFHWAVKGWPEIGDQPHPDPVLARIWAMQRAQALPAPDYELLLRYRLPREALPSEWLQDAKVWAMLLKDMPLTAMVRNLPTMTRLGMFGSDTLAKVAATRAVIDALTNQERLQAARVHPLTLLIALKTYASGQSVRGKSTWTPDPVITQVLEQAFYLAFTDVRPTYRRINVALDVSGSMASEKVAGAANMSAREASAALALVFARSEPQVQLSAFAHGYTPLTFGPETRLQDAVAQVSRFPLQRTDCALPMIHAREHRIPYDAFVVITDNETWSGKEKPVEALQRYREVMGIPHARLAVIAMTADKFTIADPRDAGMLDFVGFDSAVPALLSDFLTGFSDQSWQTNEEGEG